MFKIRYSFLILIAITFYICLNVSADSSMEYKNPTYLIDEVFGFTKYNADTVARPSGWDVDRSGGLLIQKYYSDFKLSDKRSDAPVVISRQFKDLASGRATLELVFSTSNVADGVFCEVAGGMRICTSNGFLCYQTDDGNLVQITPYIANVTQFLKVEFDLDTKTIAISINGGTALNINFLAGTIGSLNKIAIGTSNTTITDVTIRSVKLYKNYIVNERFYCAPVGSVPIGWNLMSNTGITGSMQSVQSMPNPDSQSFKILDNSGTQGSSLAKDFENQSGKTAFEVKFLLPQKVNDIHFVMKNDNQTVVNVTTKLEQIYVGNTPLYTYLGNMWYHLKIIADTNSQKSDVYLNDKLIIKDVPFEAQTDFINRIQISTGVESVGTLFIDDVLVYSVLPLPSDYVTTPILPSTNNYNIGMISCSIWREGYHLGWDKINSEPQRKPYLGFYDEGSHEVADWEIKWLAEHGITFEMFCWFTPDRSTSVPIKTSQFSAGLHEGYFNAQYSDKMKFAIMWENSYFSCRDSADFRQNIVPYWVEYYLKDKRYMTLDNKPIISIYSYSALISKFGSAENAKLELDYLRQVCKDLGYADAIILIQTYGVLSITNDSGALQPDGCFVYIPRTPEVMYAMGQRGVFQNLLNNATTKTVPTLSMGKNPTAWSGGQVGNYLLPSEFQAQAEWIKSQYLTSFGQSEIFSKLLLIDNWNEFGEGHFTMPSELYGFGYLDAIYQTFAQGGTTENIRPTQNQLSRINNLYTQDRKVFYHPNTILSKPFPNNEYKIKAWDFANASDSLVWTSVNSPHQVSNLRVENGLLCGQSTGADPQIKSLDNLGIDLTNVKFIKVTMSTQPVGERMQMYFITNDNTVWDEAKTLVSKSVSNESLTDYYFVASENSSFKGTLKQLRFDAMNCSGQFQIKSIELLGDKIAVDVNYFIANNTVTALDLGVLAAQIKIKNNTDNEIFNKLCVMAHYEGKNLVGITTRSLTIAQQQSNNFTLSLNIAKVFNDSSIKIYLWDGYSNIVPLMEKKFFY